MKNIHKFGLMGLVSLGVVLADQLSKILAISVLTLKKIVEIAPFLNFVLVKNHGVSFGTFNHAEQNQIIFIMLSLIIIAALLFFLLKSEQENLCFPIGLVVGGAVGNLIDRIVHGAVIDFIDVVIVNWHYPTFNIADAAICLGAFIMIVLPSHRIKGE